MGINKIPLHITPVTAIDNSCLPTTTFDRKIDFFYQSSLELARIPFYWFVNNAQNKDKKINDIKTTLNNTNIEFVFSLPIDFYSPQIHKNCIIIWGKDKDHNTNFYLLNTKDFTITPTTPDSTSHIWQNPLQCVTSTNKKSNKFSPSTKYSKEDVRQILNSSLYDIITNKTATAGEEQYSSDESNCISEYKNCTNELVKAAINKLPYHIQSEQKQYIYRLMYEGYVNLEQLQQSYAKHGGLINKLIETQNYPTLTALIEKYGQTISSRHKQQIMAQNNEEGMRAITIHDYLLLNQSITQQTESKKTMKI